MTRTRQEIFDLAWNGLKAQGFKPSVDDGVCSYRGEGGRRCAVGHCIPDARYKTDFEGRSIMWLESPDHEIRRAAGIRSGDLAFAAELQTCHDSSDSPKGMEKRLRAFAANHSLTVPSPALSNPTQGNTR